MLATVLSNQLGRPVQNKTGSTVASISRFVGHRIQALHLATARIRPSLFTALREQLGFRLIAQRTPTDVVVIDHVERTPTEN
jgi:uncharacterized protein (TIGR03435 family)